jgi:hypothetical protein
MTEDIPKFEPSAETDLLCSDLPKDATGRVMEHLLKQSDIARQQNTHIIGMVESVADLYNKHDADDRAYQRADLAWKKEMTPKIEASHDIVLKLRSLFGRKGIITTLILAILTTAFCAYTVEKAKDWAKTNLVQPSK